MSTKKRKRTKKPARPVTHILGEVRPVAVQVYPLTNAGEFRHAAVRFLCGAAAKRDGSSLSIALNHVASQWPESARRRKPCSDCLKLAALPRDEREAAIAERDATRRARFEALATKSKASRKQALEQMAESVAIAREDAIAVLDAWHRGEHLTPHRGNIGFVDPVIGHRRVFDARLDTGLVLAMAIAAYHLANPKSGGTRLFVTKKIELEDRLVEVHCRFCRVLLVARATIGDPHEQDPHTRRHTELCALRYLSEQALSPDPEAQFSDVMRVDSEAA